MNKKWPENIEELREFFNKSKTIEDLFNFESLVSRYFETKNHKGDKIINEEDDFCINIIEKILNKESFIDALEKTLDQFKCLKINYSKMEEPKKKFWEMFDEVEIKNRKTICIHLRVAMSFLSNTIDRLEEDRIVYTAKILGMSIWKIKEHFSYKYSSSEISEVLLSSFSKNCLIKIKTPFPINLENLFKMQKISNRLISLLIKLYFKNSLLSNKFKNIEKDILNKKFGYSNIYNLNNFIRSEKNLEKKYLEYLFSSIKNTDRLKYFIKNLNNDENKDNVFDLIETSLKSFKSIERIDDDIVEIINSADKTILELQEYASKKFKAFSGKTTEEDIEWSNKVYINCCKLCGAIRGLSRSTDKEWKTNVLLKEIIEWSISTHKILNKYEIEDDWEKIYRYLNQETNTVEWKSTFLTPTKKIDDSEKYLEVSKKIFYQIIKTMLGMMNSDGGVIIVGLVEKPEEITDSDIIEHLFVKDNKVFLDISKEFLIYKFDLDALKRKIQDALEKEVLLSLDNFNNLWTIEPIYIKIPEKEKEIIVYKLIMEKSEKNIFSAEKKTTEITSESNVWISLLKRADARTIRVDPRKYLTR